MILIIAGLLGGILIALDAQQNLRKGLATTVFRTYSKQDDPTAFWLVFATKVLLSAALAIFASALIVRNST